MCFCSFAPLVLRHLLASCLIDIHGFKRVSGICLSVFYLFEQVFFGSYLLMWTCYTFTEDSHNTGNFMPYSFRIVCRFFNVPRNCEHSRVVRRGLQFIVLIREELKVLTICRCNYKGSTFSSVILRP